jgi:protein TonB
MDAKKNPKKDLSRNSQLYFAIGLVLILALTYIALEWKTEVLKTPPPPPSPVNPPILDVVPDDFKGPETEIIVSHPIDQPMAVDSVDYIEPEIDVLIPIGVVENKPIFPGCENEDDKHACFNKMMKKHIIKNFHYPEIEQEMGIEGRVFIMFEIQKDGKIGNIRMRGPNKNLEKDAARIISKLPKMTPGKQGGKNVRVPFSIPITYELN